jgi:hypothetical protein
LSLKTQLNETLQAVVGAVRHGSRKLYIILQRKTRYGDALQLLIGKRFGSRMRPLISYRTGALYDHHSRLIPILGVPGTGVEPVDDV